MAAHRIRIGVLTSSRADFGIYLPLLKKMKVGNLFQLKLIVFGTHLSRFHGYTVSEIEAQGFEPHYKLDTLLVGDSAESIATSMSLCMMKFAQFWGTHSQEFDVVLCLGDRYEMFAAVSAGVPLGIRFAHLHGGEKTLGAIDNFFRHSISHASWCHFTATEFYSERLVKMLDEPERVFNVGSLSLDSLTEIPILEKEEMTKRFGVEFDKPIALVTFHPETIGYDRNLSYAHTFADIMQAFPHINFVVTLPNADTGGTSVRSIFMDRLKDQDHVKLLENFGTQGYFSLMHHARFLLGNSSSGIIEAASFGKYVINVGDRQKGRLQSNNVFNVPIEFNGIKLTIEKISTLGLYTEGNIYFKSGAADNIIALLKKHV